MPPQPQARNCNRLNDQLSGAPSGAPVDLPWPCQPSTRSELLAAALLHDTVEDTETTLTELEQTFGPTISALVAEVTDDKSLPKQERKALQIEHSAQASAAAKQLKIADKIANVRDILADPPADWPLARKREYLDWAEQVVRGCRGVNAALDACWKATLAEARGKLEAEAR
ncbi:GTP pyrophosphokinase rsh [Thiorhodovibrio winogradskyi]|uniref:GTP pyrophosphokinase rsh n=1 Tax=Thiorhodovibrio winogradskyi TaxID=77007 RepID=A0ABZ0SEI5_9GAMM|nr:HD domain-containing protein [Thiorhodovibrio winogradskyi]